MASTSRDDASFRPYDYVDNVFEFSGCDFDPAAFDGEFVDDDTLVVYCAYTDEIVVTRRERHAPNSVRMFEKCLDFLARLGVDGRINQYARSISFLFISGLGWGVPLLQRSSSDRD